VLALAACARGDLAAATHFTADAVAARDSGPLRGAPHSLPVTCATARLLTLSGDPAEAVARCRAGLELAQDWRDSSLMVPAALLELARAEAALGRVAEADTAARAGRARLAGARDAGVLAAELAAFEVRQAADRPRGSAGLGSRPARDFDELSAREVEVLRRIAGPGSLREVADALYISRNTIKTHTRALYAKLGVGTREEAVERGRDLGLLGSTARPGPAQHEEES
jgi:LuxR family maltose regulon positive regulatory protein